MHVFSHSSKTDGGNDGLEFLSTRNDRNEVTEDGTISYDEISQLEKLRWSPNANLVLHGCNTGLRGTSVQSIADVFAIRQEKCRVHGQKKVGLIFPEKKLFTSVPHQLIKKFICGHLVEEIITMLAILLVVRKSLP